MPTVTAQDLQDWSPRLDARAHLPTLIRRLIFASVRPDQIVVPDAEGTGFPGLDGILFSAAGALPYVPAGRSAWELKTSGDPQTELGKDYRKRTKQLTAAERATTTIVLVTTRIWDKTSIDKWIARRAKDGWADIKVITAEDLATWLSQCPGVLGWLEEHCGRNPYGRTALRDWWENWSNATEPSVPPALLLAGRGAEANELLTGLAGAASSRVAAAGTEEEAIAFLAAALLVPRPLKTTDDGEEPTEEEIAAHDTEEASWREAILERTIVVHDTNAWRSLAAHHEPLILVPTATCEPTIDAAAGSGHHVVLPRTARPGERSLPRLDRIEARQAWEQAGVPWNESDELARAARRSLTSLRRRRGRAGHLRRPDWSSGTSSRLLAPLLLAGSWDSTLAGDERIVLELADRQSLRSLDGDLAVIASESDPPIRQRKGGWQFADPVDAWDQLGPVISQHDLDLFRERAIEVLTYRNPTLDLPAAERLTADLRGELPPPEYSQTLREGFAETIAILGAIREDTSLPGGGTGGSLAARIVHDLLHGASAARWRGVVDLLPELAEAAPSAFLIAVEESLREADPPILTLFNERPDDFGLSHHSAHTHLLWALEHLAFSPAHLSRVVVTLGLLTEQDPGGTLQNRPASSLRDILHLIYPQSAVDGSGRLAAIDALRTAAPQASWPVLLGLVQALDRGMVLNRGPKHRDWPRAEPPAHRDVFEAVTEIGDRIVDDIRHDAGRWTEAMGLVTKLPASVRTRMLTEAGAVWNQLSDDTQRAMVAEVQDQVSRHTKYRDSTWALNEEGLAELAAFVQVHATEADEPGAHLLFSFWPDIDGQELDTPEGQAALKALREDAVRAALPDGIPALAAASELPGHIGTALAAVTADLDDEVLGWLASDEPHLRPVGYGLARVHQEQEPDWLWRTIETHAVLKVELLLTSDLNNAVIAYVDTMSDDDQAAFWAKVGPWAVPDDVRLTVAQNLSDRDRPFSAMNLLFRDDTDTFPLELGLEVMAKPLTGTGETVEVLHSPRYVLRGMLDRLAAAGAPTEQLAILEWWYNPALRHERTPAAFNTMLAKDPVLFARLVALTTYSDDDLDDTNDNSDDHGEEVDDNVEGEVQDDEDDDDDGDNDCGGGGGDDGGGGGDGGSSWRFPDTPENRRNAFEMLREWRVPVPGSVGDDPPETAALQDWVDRARAELAVLERTRAGAQQIGHALSGPAYDPDGTWPCRAVRDVLEHENDSEIETGLWSGRMNSRGVTSRDPYSGGQQERDLAAKYKGWADQVRGTWPRTGALLDSIAESYEAQARREDGSADELGDR
jgi:hypothetical protein